MDAHAHETEHTPQAGSGLPVWQTLAVVTVAFLVRAAYLAQAEDMPLFYHLIGDGARYWDWAGRIAGGDWLGGEVFYQAPAYPYFLAVVRCLVGDSLWWAHLAQAGLGALACGLLAAAAARFTSRTAGLCSGFLLALYGPAVFFDGLIQKATLSLFLICALLYLLARLTSPPSSRHRREVFIALAAGVVLGLLALTREQALLLGGGVVLWLAVGFPTGERSRRLGLGLAVLFVLGCTAVLSLVAWRNYHVGGEWVITTVQAGPNFYIGNHEGATGRYEALKPGAEWPPLERQAATELAEAAIGTELTPREVSRYWLSKSWTYIRQHPADWVGLMLHKWALTWNAYEISDTESLTLYGHLSWLLGVLSRVNHFGLLAPLAVLGAALTINRWRRLWLLYAMIVLTATGVTLFFVFARYRFPLVPLLAIFAGAGVCELGAWVRNGFRSITADSALRRHPWLVMLLTVGAAVGCNVRFGHERLLDGTAYENWGAILTAEGNPAAAAYLLGEALRYKPESPAVHTRLGVALAAQGELPEAKVRFDEALELDPEFAPAHYHLGMLMASLGRTETAEAHLRRAAELEPRRGRAHFQLGLVLARVGRSDEAIDAYRKAL
ncbi:MAG: tetratricopeptide repeat protein, partial [bacterium]|nr:tetratricopeptide repeat protein [bacterium]